MVVEPGAYRWSSYGHNALGRGDRVDSEQEAYLGLGRAAGIRQATYRQLLGEALSEEELGQIRSATQLGWPMGNDRFKADIEAMLRRRVPCNTWGGARCASSRKPGTSAQ
jgi:putative transposase